MTGIGPVEPAEPEPTAPAVHAPLPAAPPPDVIAGNTRRLSDHWAQLPPRIRSALAVIATTALAVTGALLLPDPPSAAPPDAAPLPWPATVTQFRYLDSAQANTRSGTFRFEVSIDSGPPVTVTGITAAFHGLRTRTLPDTTLTVRAGTPRRITVHIAVTSCEGLPLDADLPFFDVTLRNTRAIQHHSFIFSGAYARDLSQLLHTACDSASSQAPPHISGSAASQHMDLMQATQTSRDAPMRHPTSATS